MSQPALQPSYGGYSSDPESRRHHRHSHPRRRLSPQQEKDHLTQDSLIGAAGGGLIGDLIFPGLGTVGGALAGWISGRDYGKFKERQDEARRIEQERWEKRFHKGSYRNQRPKV